MKKILLLFFISFIFVSCVEDAETVNKRDLFNTFIKMKKALSDDNIKWIKRNSFKSLDVESMKDILLTNDDSIKSFVSSNKNEIKTEYSATIIYSIDFSKQRLGTIILRSSYYNPTYYYIKLVFNNNKWLIESIDKLPLN